MFKTNLNKKGQVWIETVLYTLIGITLIGIALTFISPRISDARDRSLVEQTVGALTRLDEQINSALRAPDNIRTFDFTMRRGELFINSSGEEIIFLLRDLEKPYSEVGQEIKSGRVGIISSNSQGKYNIELRLDYKDKANLTYRTNDVSIQKFNAATTPYRFSIRNKGSTGPNLPIIDIDEISGR